MQDRTKADLRSVADYVALLIEEDLRKRTSKASRRVRGASPDDRRASYEIGLWLTPEQGKRIKARVERERWSIPSYVAKVTVEATRG